MESQQHGRLVCLTHALRQTPTDVAADDLYAFAKVPMTTAVGRAEERC